MRKSESFKHFHRAACDPVGLTQLQRTGFLLDDHRANVREGRQLGRQRESGRAAANDQDVGLGRQGGAWRLGGDCRVQKAGIACSEAVQVKLHVEPL